MATNVNLFLDVNYAAQAGDSFQVFTGARPGSGVFNITTDLGSGLAWDASRLSSSGILTVVPVPEPWLSPPSDSAPWSARSGGKALAAEPS